MARNRQNLNIIYISDRMRETLRPIASCALTAVVAPMAGAVVLQASIYSDNRSIFWKSVQKAFAAAGLTVLEGYDCPADASGAALLLEDLCAALGGKTPYYLFLDDFHLLGDERVAQFLCRLAYRLPENVHLIVASRNRFLPGEQVVRLGRRLHRIEADGLRLNREELLAYCRKHIAKYAMPSDIEFRDELPKTLVGKVAYRVLEDEEKARIAAQAVQPEA